MQLKLSNNSCDFSNRLKTLKQIFFFLKHVYKIECCFSYNTIQLKVYNSPELRVRFFISIFTLRLP